MSARSLFGLMLAFGSGCVASDDAPVETSNTEQALDNQFDPTSTPPTNRPCTGPKGASVTSDTDIRNAMTTWATEVGLGGLYQGAPHGCPTTPALYGASIYSSTTTNNTYKYFECSGGVTLVIPYNRDVNYGGSYGTNRCVIALNRRTGWNATRNQWFTPTVEQLEGAPTSEEGGFQTWNGSAWETWGTYQRFERGGMTWDDSRDVAGKLGYAVSPSCNVTGCNNLLAADLDGDANVSLAQEWKVRPFILGGDAYAQTTSTCNCAASVCATGGCQRNTVTTYNRIDAMAKNNVMMGSVTQRRRDAFPGRFNVASSVNGGIAIASSTYAATPPTASYYPSYINDGATNATGPNTYWVDQTASAWPDTVDIVFNGKRAIDMIDVYGLRDNYFTAASITASTQCTLFCPRSLAVLYWNGVSWALVPGGEVLSNSFVWRRFTFSPIVTDKIRVQINGSPPGYAYSALGEIQAWSVASYPGITAVGALPINNWNVDSKGIFDAWSARGAFAYGVSTQYGETFNGGADFQDLAVDQDHQVARAVTFKKGEVVTGTITKLPGEPAIAGAPIAIAAPMPDTLLGKSTFGFVLSRSIKASSGDPDSDQDGLHDDLEKQLAFLTAPRVYYDENDTTIDHSNIRLREMHLTQVRPRSPSVSQWIASVADPKWITLRFIFEYPYQGDNWAGQRAHTGDGELYELRMYSYDLKEWRAGEFVFPPHGDADYFYYGDVGILAGRAAQLGTAYTWVAVDEGQHGCWGGEDLLTDDCAPQGSSIHDCFAGVTYANGVEAYKSFLSSFTEGDYFWFDTTRDLGEPESPRYLSWAPEIRGESNPQIHRMAGNRFAAMVNNDVGNGEAWEFVRYTAVSPFIDMAQRNCGWRCADRHADGDCRTPPDELADGDTWKSCDGGGVIFNDGPRTTTVYGDLYPVGSVDYRNYPGVDFTYQLWGLPNQQHLLSGNFANPEHYPLTAIAASPSATGSGDFSDYGANNGDRRGIAYGDGGTWLSATAPSPTAPQSVRISFGASRSISRVDVFGVQSNPATPGVPNPALTTAYALADYKVQYCNGTDTMCPIDGDPSGWHTLATVEGNAKVWRTHSFAPVFAQRVRLRITRSLGGNAQVAELETWE